MNISTARAGTLTFYILNFIFTFYGGTLTDPSDHDTYIWVGRMMAVFGALPLIFMGVSELSLSELREELNGRPGEELWISINKLLAWGSPCVAAWHFYKGNTWDGLMMLAYPSWLILLWTEARRRANKHRRSPSLRSKVFFYLALISATLFFTAMITPDWGPTLPGAGGYKLYPLLVLFSLMAAIIDVFACGGWFSD